MTDMKVKDIVYAGLRRLAHRNMPGLHEQEQGVEDAWELCSSPATFLVEACLRNRILFNLPAGGYKKKEEK